MREVSYFCPAKLHPRSFVVPGSVPARCLACYRLRSWKNSGVSPDTVCQKCGYSLIARIMSNGRTGNICKGHPMDLDKLNSATKYPSIETYHELNPQDGTLMESVPHKFTGSIIMTEKINGANGRIIITPSGDWFIGSREELLYARGDRIKNPQLSIVPTLLTVAERVSKNMTPAFAGTLGIETYYFEVYGHRISGAHKDYTSTAGLTGARLFDVSWVPSIVLDLETDQVSSWRQHGNQKWSEESYLQHYAEAAEIELTPRLGIIPAGEELPFTIDGTYRFLKATLPVTEAALDGTPNGKGEGIVFRTEDRSIIAKAKFRDYERTIRIHNEGKRPGEQGKS